MSDDLPGGASLGTPSSGPSSVSIDPNGTYTLPGFDTPLRGEQVRSGLMLNADYTQKTQQLAEKARQVDQILGQASEALSVMAALEENPEAALATLAQIYGTGQSTANSGQQQQSAQQTQPQQGGMPPEMAQFLDAQAQRIQALEGQLYGYMANTQLQTEWKGLEGRDARMASDPELRARVSGIAAQFRLPLDKAYDLATIDEVRSKADTAQAEARTRTLRQFMPSLGAGSRPTEQPKLNSDDLFAQSFIEALKEHGFVDS